MPKFKTVQAWILVALLAAACGGGSDAPPELGAAPPLSVVVLGDSIASGEGINYGYNYYTGHPNDWYGGRRQSAMAGRLPALPRLGAGLRRCAGADDRGDADEVCLHRVHLRKRDHVRPALRRRAVSAGTVRQLARDDQSQRRLRRRQAGCRDHHAGRRRRQLRGYLHLLRDRHIRTPRRWLRSPMRRTGRASFAPTS